MENHLRKSGPKTLRRRKGDLPLVRAASTIINNSEGVLLAVGPERGDKALVPVSSKKPESSKKTPLTKGPRKSTCISGQSNLPRDSRKNIPNLLFNKTRLLATNLQSAPRRKKSSKKSRGENRSDLGDEASDSIHNHDSATNTLKEDRSDINDIEIEVVLPHIPGPATELSPLAECVVSGMDSIILPEGDTSVRRKVEVSKLIDIVEEVGLKFHGEIGEDLARLLDMDYEEKEGWEMRSGNSSVQ